MDADDIGGRVRELLQKQPVLDGHNDLPWEARERCGYDWDRLDLAAGGLGDLLSHSSGGEGSDREDSSAEDDDEF